jgi:hypothetical protein
MVRMSGKLRKEGQDTLRYTLGIEAVIGTEEFLWTMLHELVGNPYA